MQINAFRNCLIFYFDVQYLNRIFAKVIMLSINGNNNYSNYSISIIKSIMLSVTMVTFPPSTKLVPISRREKGKRIREAMLFLEKKRF